MDLTPILGTEFVDARLAQWMSAPNADAMLRDLAIKISERGVVFFRGQDDLTNEMQKQLMQRLGELSGKPRTSSLHVHPVISSERTLADDLEISVISTELGSGRQMAAVNPGQWHTEIAFELVPADYTSLRLTKLPKTDTMWASGYEIYDRISHPYRRFLEGLTATFALPSINTATQRLGSSLYDGARGSPDNVGADLKAVHPVVRTNPVTGWKSIYPIGLHVSHINGVTPEESQNLCEWLLQMIYRNHDLQVRFKWQNKNDIAIWDNRSVFHAATFDFEGLGERLGDRAVGVGERPFFDPNSTSRRESLNLPSYV
ncbi:hypothetical protein COCMIDRAFT_103933 [Bipolaris oryzae ATCC 44560]|uniref:TauD/TfdA-like domain-containing protein n=1 Tax=Bipolaris oryzae ATCC 44560 TaxID=930090 RepID=W6ZFJ8_COCMI|nr:uncharacterized protein COCMIDRAFT_103933 [Bipolaris oryzae ATCC 44560]EUC42256.1 hypothetical protein COCMIDRAFT_103933 [Bipolaris oryzae ATCC 44560]